MPKIVKTSISTGHQGGAYYFMNVVKAVAEACNTTYTRYDDESDPERRSFYILTDSIGYPGFCLCFVITGYGTSSTSQFMAIRKTTSTNEPDVTDDYSIGVDNSRIADTNIGPNSAATCVVFKDASNDTVTFSVHAGSSEASADASGWYYSPFKFFFARDIKNEVLIGCGPTHIDQLRTKTKKLILDKSKVLGEAYDGMATCLHLTKMINYLSPEYAEMKSAYVSVVRPAQDTDEEFNKVYYADGARWGFAGCYTGNFQSGNRTKYLKAFTPWVKY